MRKISGNLWRSSIGMVFVALSKYAINNKLMENYIWEWDNRYAKNAKKLKEMVKNLLANKRASRGVKYTFFVRIPMNISE